MSEKLNCWQVKQCGCERGGENVPEKGICPAATDHEYHGANHGRACGRFCWTVPDSFCQQDPQQKYVCCLSCDFFKQVLKEEGVDFVMTRSAFINFDQPQQTGKHEPCSSDKQCEYMHGCGFFRKYAGSEEAKKHGWMVVFCNHQSSSFSCERRILREETGEIPPDDLTPTGILLSNHANSS